MTQETRNITLDLVALTESLPDDLKKAVVEVAAAEVWGQVRKGTTRTIAEALGGRMAGPDNDMGTGQTSK